MTRPWRYFALALVLAPALAWGIHRLAKELGGAVGASRAAVVSMSVSVCGSGSSWRMVGSR